MNDRARTASFLLAIGAVLQFSMAAVAVHRKDYGLAVLSIGVGLTLLTVAIIHAIYGAQGR